MRLILHIGLPKTGTTFLQKNIFPLLFRHNFLWRRLAGDNNAEHKIQDIQRFLRSQGKFLERTTLDTLKNFTQLGLVSNENISILPSMWEHAQIVQPEVIAINVLRLSKLLYFKPDEIGLIISIRKQDSWFASRYAESSKRMTNPSQLDFECKIKYILDKSRTHKLWLDYSYLRDVFEAALPSTHILFVVQEELEQDPQTAVQGLMKFVNMQADFPPELFNVRVNSLSNQQNHWLFKPFRHDGIQRADSLTLTPVLSKQILSAYEASNRLFCASTCPVISRFGYFDGDFGPIGD